MILRKLSIIRSQETDKKGITKFQTRVSNKRSFTYLRTDQRNKTSTERWKNNFYAGYSSIIKGRKEIILLSIDGISYFNEDLNGPRRNVKLLRTSTDYQDLERSVDQNKRSTIEKILIKYYRYHN